MAAISGVALLRCNGSPGCFDTFGCKICFHLKRGIWTTEVTVQFFFFLAQVRHFWWCFLFSEVALVALFLKMSERGDSWCTDFSFSSFLVKLSQVFESALLDSILKLGSFLLLVHIFLPNFFLPVNFAFNMLWYTTPWTAPPPTLSVMILCDLLSLWRVSMIVFWTIAKSAVFPIIVVSKNKRYPQSIRMDGHLLETQISNILIFWDTDFWLSLSVSVNHKNLNKKTFEVFYSTCNDFKIYEKLHFLNFFTIFNLFLVTVLVCSYSIFLF